MPIPAASLTVTEAAAVWGCGPNRVRTWLRAGRVPSAVNVAGRWFIPADATRPLPLRRGRKPKGKTK